VRITCVELENIKSYRKVSIPLPLGTIAIRGHNGAGKSTFVEAIGFALFDSLPYDQSKFVREGEKSGTVTVTFASALDEREYQVVRRCGSNSTWYIYDPELDARPAEQKVDVTDFLRRHLRLEAEIGMKDLFNDALGVPQGTFTADFLLTPANRKKKFDALLQVEDYRKAWEKLGDTRTYLTEQRYEIQRRIDQLERDTNQLPEWRAELATSRRLESSLGGRLQQIEQETLVVEQERKTLREREEQVRALEASAQIASTTSASAEEALRKAEERLRETREAVSICEQTQAAHDQYVATQQPLREARERQRSRDALQRSHAVLTGQHESTQKSLDQTRQRLDQAAAAAARIAELAPAIQRQEYLENQRDTSHQQVQRLEAARRELRQAMSEREAVSRQLTECDRSIADIEAQRPLAEELPARRERVSMLQSMRATKTEKQKQLKTLEQSRKAADQRRERAAQDVAREAANVKKLADQRETVASLPALEKRYSDLQARLQAAQATLAQHEEARKQSGAGNCPFLGESCLNIRKRGENNLGTYFDHIIIQDRKALAPIREELAALEPELEHSRTVARWYERLDEYTARHARAQEDLETAQRDVETLRQQYDELTDWLANAPGEQDLADAQAAFKASDDADRQLHRLEPLRMQREQHETRLRQLAAAEDALRQEEQSLADAPERLRAIEADLVALHDPRRQVATLEVTAGERDALASQVATLESQLAQQAAEIARLDAELTQYVGLNAELQALEETAARTQADYTRHLQFQQAAQRLPEREQETATAREALRKATEAQGQIAMQLAAARAQFDPEALFAANRRAEELSAERGSTAAQLVQAQENSATYESAIAHAEELLLQLDATRKEMEATQDLEKMLLQFRDTIREAGPNVMKALLRHISIEANRIFGELMGERSSQLSWESDYEVVLRRDGRERTFAQLSGGEQMCAALAVRLALLRSLTRLDIAFFDEPTQNMDDERRYNLAEQIRRVRGFDQLFVISHDDTFEQGLDSVIHLEKRAGETIVIENDALVPA